MIDRNDFPLRHCHALLTFYPYFSEWKMTLWLLKKVTIFVLKTFDYDLLITNLNFHVILIQKVWPKNFILFRKFGSQRSKVILNQKVNLMQKVHLTQKVILTQFWSKNSFWLKNIYPGIQFDPKVILMQKVNLIPN